MIDAEPTWSHSCSAESRLSLTNRALSTARFMEESEHSRRADHLLRLIRDNI
jgi:hypothetical protein